MSIGSHSPNYVPDPPVPSLELIKRAIQQKQEHIDRLKRSNEALLIEVQANYTEIEAAELQLADYERALQLLKSTTRVKISGASNMQHIEI